MAGTLVTVANPAAVRGTLLLQVAQATFVWLRLAINVDVVLHYYLAQQHHLVVMHIGVFVVLQAAIQII